MTDRKESNIRYIASCSFGKDSIAAIITRLQRGEPVDEIVQDDAYGNGIRKTVLA